MGSIPVGRAIFLWIDQCNTFGTGGFNSIGGCQMRWSLGMLVIAVSLVPGSVGAAIASDALKSRIEKIRILTDEGQAAAADKLALELTLGPEAEAELRLFHHSQLKAVQIFYL